MDKTFLAYVAVGIGFLYFVTNFVGDIQAEDERYRNSGYEIEHKYDKYMGVDSIGQDVLKFTGVNVKTQKAAWNASQIKQEFLEIFPDFAAMRAFVSDRIEGDGVKSTLLAKIKEVEDKYFSGEMTAEQAKFALDSL